MTIDTIMDSMNLLGKENRPVTESSHIILHLTFGDVILATIAYVILATIAYLPLFRQKASSAKWIE